MACGRQTHRGGKEETQAPVYTLILVTASLHSLTMGDSMTKCSTDMVRGRPPTCPQEMLASWSRPFLHKFGETTPHHGSVRHIELSIVESRVSHVLISCIDRKSYFAETHSSENSTPACTHWMFLHLFTLYVHERLSALSGSENSRRQKPLCVCRKHRLYAYTYAYFGLRYKWQLF